MFLSSHDISNQIILFQFFFYRFFNRIILLNILFSAFIDEYIYSLEEFKKNILENDKEKLKSVLNKTNRIKEILNKNVDHEK